MTYEEIAAAYDAQADAMLAVAPAPGTNWEFVGAVLELRERAASCRRSAEEEKRSVEAHARRIACEEFDRQERLKWMEFQAKNTESMAKQAAAFEAIAKKATTDGIMLYGPRGTEIVK